ncbi:MAG TPA: vWA domain-containing protein [Tepidisphaeraceae bacterium]
MTHRAFSSLTFDASWASGTVLALAAIAALITYVRRPVAPRGTFILCAAGLLLFALAAANPIWRRPARQEVAVMVDLSPSTRTARYRDRATLERRIAELLRDTPYRIQYFADGTRPADASGPRLPDLHADCTRYSPPAAAAVLLFSDCRFALPEQSPPTYVCVDVGLDDPPDAAVASLEIRGTEAAVSLRNGGDPRRLTLNGTSPANPTTLPGGSLVITRPLARGASQIAAELSPGDPWPENDALATVVPPPQEFERWWVGRSGPGSGWRVMNPGELPTEPDAYLSAAVIVLDNVAASDLSDLQQQRLQQYVRDLGGGLLILGGNRAFAPGGYEGTPIDALSPLASSPPAPTNHWVLLADASGSMSEAVPGGTRWQSATGAIALVLPHLPPQDVASVGCFAETLQWWIDAIPAREAAKQPIPLGNAYPHGPTNLQPALEAIARSADGKMPVQLLVLSDFETQISGAPQLADLLKSKNIHLHLLAIGEGTALPMLRQIAALTGGRVLTEIDPSRWSAAVRELARAAGNPQVQRTPVKVTFESPLQGMPPQSTDLWNRTWMKDGASKLAEARPDAAEPVPMAARWNAGEGRVLAAAFVPDAGVVERLASLVARPPRDPRFHVTWESGPRLRVTIDAVDGRQYLNGQNLSLELNAPRHPIPQTGPGRYELTMQAPRSPAIATVRAGDQVLDRIALAGRYAPEFDEVGNDLAAMRELARRSGGVVVPPGQAKPLDIHWPVREVSIASLLAVAGAACVVAGLLWWQRG